MSRRDFCPSCKQFSQMTIGQDGFADCSLCGRHELPSHMHCWRCGFACTHVEAGGIHGCPNCGDPKDAGGGMVTYDFERGCSSCGLSGHPPKPGFMEPAPKGHPRVALGLAPSIEDCEAGIERIMEE